MHHLMDMLLGWSSQFVVDAAQCVCVFNKIAAAQSSFRTCGNAHIRQNGFLDIVGARLRRRRNCHLSVAAKCILYRHILMVLAIYTSCIYSCFCGAHHNWSHEWNLVVRIGSSMMSRHKAGSDKIRLKKSIYRYSESIGFID